MCNNLNELKVEQISNLIKEKRNLYDQMIIENKEFEQVKALFLEIKALEQRQASLTNAN